MAAVARPPLSSQAGGGTTTGCSTCGSATYIQALLDKFGERVCKACLRQTDGFRTLNKTAAKADFLLTDSELASLPSELKPNPRNSRFRDMRLYLLKQVRDKSYAKWKGPDGLEAEHHKRRLARFNGGKHKAAAGSAPEAGAPPSAVELAEAMGLRITGDDGGTGAEPAGADDDDDGRLELSGDEDEDSDDADWEPEGAALVGSVSRPVLPPSLLGRLPPPPPPSAAAAAAPGRAADAAGAEAATEAGPGPGAGTGRASTSLLLQPGASKCAASGHDFADSGGTSRCRRCGIESEVFDF